jgi:hypothetical protein
VEVQENGEKTFQLRSKSRIEVSRILRFRISKRQRSLSETAKHPLLVKMLHIQSSITEQQLAEPGGLAYFKPVDFKCYLRGAFSP